MTPQERLALKKRGIIVDDDAVHHGVKAGPELPPGVVLDEPPPAESAVNVVDLEDPSGRGRATTAAYPDWVPPEAAQAIESFYQGTGGIQSERRAEAAAAGIAQAGGRQGGGGVLSSGPAAQQDFERRASAAQARAPGAGLLGQAIGSLPQLEALGTLVPGGATSPLGRVAQGAAGGGLLGILSGARDFGDVSRQGIDSARMHDAAATGAAFGAGGAATSELLSGLARDVPAGLTRLVQRRRATPALADQLRARSLGAYQGDILAAEEAPAAARRDFEPPDSPFPSADIPAEPTAVDSRTVVRPRETMTEMVEGDQAHQQAMRDADAAVQAENAQAAGQRVQQDEAAAMRGGPTRVTARENAARQAASDKLTAADADAAEMQSIRDALATAEPTNPRGRMPLELAPTDPGVTVDPRRIEAPQAVETTPDPRVDVVNAEIQAERAAARQPNQPVEPLPRDFGRADMGYRTGPPRPEYTEAPPPAPNAGARVRYRYDRPRSRLAQLMDEARRSGIITEGGGDVERIGELAGQRAAEGGKRMGEALRSTGRENLLSGEDVQRALSSEPRLRTLADSPDIREQDALVRPGNAVLTELGRGGGNLSPGGYERLRNALSRMAGYGQRAAAGSMEAGPLSAAAGGTRSAIVRAADEALGEMGAEHQAARGQASMEEIADWAKTRGIREAANNTITPSSQWMGAVSKPAGVLWHLLRPRMHALGADMAEAAVGIPAVQRTGLNPRFNVSQLLDLLKGGAEHVGRRGAVDAAEHYKRSERDSQYRRRVLGTR